jgi:hypothetical protein
MHTLSSEAKLEINNIRDALIAEKSYQLFKTSDINIESAFISLATTCHNYSDCIHFT